MSTTGRVLRLVAACAALLVVYFVLPAEKHMASDVVVRALIALVILGLLAYLIIRQFRLEMHLGADYRVDGLLVSIFGVVVAFSFAFYLLGRNDPGQMAGLHTRIDALYFTVSTLTTVGFGDVHAAGQAARVLVLIQMGFNLIFITSAAALLSGKIRSTAEQRARLTRGQPPEVT
jgi:voltage-gated potassium channel